MSYEEDMMTPQFNLLRPQVEYTPGKSISVRPGEAYLSFVYSNGESEAKNAFAVIYVRRDRDTSYYTLKKVYEDRKN